MTQTAAAKHNITHIMSIRFWTILACLIAAQLFQTELTAYDNRQKITLTHRQQCDLELLMNGAFYPLNGFMDKQTYDEVVEKMRLPSGSLWPIPIVLDVDQKLKDHLSEGMELELRDTENTLLAILEIAEIWQPDKTHEAAMVYGTTDAKHPGVDYLFHRTGEYYVGGAITKVNMPAHYDFNGLRRTPEQLKSYFKEQGISRVVGFQTRNPLHRAHVELIQRAARQADAHALLHPVVGMTKPGDIDHFTRVKCYQQVMSHFGAHQATLSLLPLSMRMAGPREAVWHALIRKNYGCTHFIVGRDHAGPGKDSHGKDFYPPYAAQELALALADEIGLIILPFKEVVYVEEDANYQVCDEVAQGKTVLSISGTSLREMLRRGEEIPDWFSYPEVIDVLRRAMPARSQQGFVLFFTGLSGAGKSTIANALSARLMELQDRTVTILDGDVVRTHLSSELSFSKEHRSLNVRRVGFVANEIAKNHGVAICAMIAPYEEDRLYNRKLIGDSANYIEVYVSTPLNECEKRDVKGLYERARNGLLSGFTGIDDPYEIPAKAEIALDTALHTVAECVDVIMGYLINEGLLEERKEG